MVPLNFLFPIPGTPLENAPRLRPMEILKIIAVMRLILPRQDLKVAGGREKNLRDLQSWIFYVGGTSGLIGNYLATSGRPQRRRPANDRGPGTDLAGRPRRRRRPGHRLDSSVRGLDLATPRAVVTWTAGLS